MLKALSRHARLLASTTVAIVLFFLLPHEWQTFTRLLVSWNVAVLLFVALIFWMMTRMNAEQMGERYQEEDEAAPLILVVGIIAAVVAMASIIVFLSIVNREGSAERAAHISLAAVTVVASWTLIPTMFTLHYASMFYGAAPERRPLRFPDSQLPVFWDFVYFSFTIAAACQTADVSTAQGTIRKVVIAHGLLSFLFNAAILGFAINVTAGLIGAR